MTPPFVGRVVVIGAGLGGLRVVERLHARGHVGEIVLLGAERHRPYDRPPLSKQVLRGELDETSLRTVAEFARALRAALQPGRCLVVVGAGLLGCEVAASARAMAVEVALVDVLEAPAVRVLGPRVGRLLAQLHAEHGVELHLGTGVTGFAAGRLSLANGRTLPAGVVLEAIGVVPDTAWLAGSDVLLDDGVVCDADGQAAPHVYAIGDVARWVGRRHEHWTNVGRQADHVAAVILGQGRPPADVAYWWSDQYDVKVQGLGLPAADDDVEVVRWGPKARSVAVYSRGGRLTGLVGFSVAGAIMRMRPEVMAGADVTEVLGRLRA